MGRKSLDVMERDIDPCLGEERSVLLQQLRTFNIMLKSVWIVPLTPRASVPILFRLPKLTTGAPIRLGVRVYHVLPSRVVPSFHTMSVLLGGEELSLPVKIAVELQPHSVVVFWTSLNHPLRPVNRLVIIQLRVRQLIPPLGVVKSGWLYPSLSLEESMRALYLLRISRPQRGMCVKKGAVGMGDRDMLLLSRAPIGCRKMLSGRKKSKRRDRRNRTPSSPFHEPSG
mmetsp:Transcript_55285/g.108163  ORF Transcript_55285/g.108163 Transcript_55285/m.108163 type:complete len:227 (+) Transcript_55285:945-1625(+)